MSQIDPKNLMTQVVHQLNAAYLYFCRSKQKAHHNHDIWAIRFDWPKIRAQLQSTLLSGRYCLSPATARRIDNHSILFWSGIDTLVLKALSLVLEESLYPKLDIYQHCYHTKGHGLKSAIKATLSTLKDYAFVFKTDIKNYYASLNRHRIQESLARFVKDPRVLALIWQYCDRLEDVNGNYRHCNQGIPKGGALSVVLGTLYLIDLDALRHQKKIQYLRYMDDILIFCKTRYVLRKIIKQVYGILDKLKLKLAYAKTYIGKAQKGFDFLGYTIEAETHSVSLSKTTRQRFHQRLQRLYEQRAAKARVAAYVTHWCRWANSGLRDLNVKIPRQILTLIHNPDDLNSPAWLAE